MQSKWSQLCGFFYLLPLFGVVGYSVVPQFWALWLTLLSVTVTLYWLISQRACTVFPQIGLLFALFMALTALQWMLSVFHSSALVLTNLAYLLAATTMTVAGYVFKETFGWRVVASVCARASLATGLAMACVALCIFQPFSLWFNLKHIVTQLSAYAGISLGLGLSGYLYLIVTRQLSLIWGIFAGFFLLFAISVLLGTSGWWLIMMLVVVALTQQILAIRTQTGSREKRLWLHLVLLLVPVYCLLGWLIPDVSEAAGPRWWPTMLVALKMLKAHPWLGIGSGNTGWISFLAITQPAIEGRVGVFNHAPNALMQCALDYGVIGVLAVLTAIHVWLRGIHWRALQVEQIWLLSALGVMAAMSIVSAPFHDAFFLVLFAFLLGTGETQVKRFSLPRVGMTVYIVTLISMVVALTSSGLANAKLTQAARGSLQHPDTIDQLQWIHRYTLLAPFAERLFVQKIQVDHHDIDSKLWLTQSVMLYEPDIRAAYYHSLLLELAGKHRQAVSYLNATLNAYPIKLNNMLAYFSPMYMQHFLNVLLEARPPKKPAQHTQIVQPNKAT